MSHNLSCLFRNPCSTNFLSFTAYKFLSLSRTLQPSSQSCDRDINEADLSPGTMLAFVAVEDKVGGSGNVPVLVDVNVDASGRVMVGPWCFQY